MDVDETFLRMEMRSMCCDGAIEMEHHPRKNLVDNLLDSVFDFRVRHNLQWSFRRNRTDPEQVFTFEDALRC